MNDKDVFVKTLDIPLQVGSRPYQGVLGYSSDDPHSATLTIKAGSNTVPWEFDRELLREGCTREVGDGDVRVGPDVERASRVLITLTSPGGNSLTFAASKDLVTIFVTRIYAAVPEGTEYEWIDFDAEIAALLEEA